MKRLSLIGLLALLLAAAFAPPARAAFGIEEFNLGFEDGTGAPELQAGSHPFGVTTNLRFHTIPTDRYGEPPGAQELPEGATKDLEVELPAGLVGNPTAVPRCSNADFININFNELRPHCPDSSVVGLITLKVFNNSNEVSFINAAVFDLVAAPGTVQKLGFTPYGVPIAFDFRVKPNQPYNVVAKFSDTSQALSIYGAKLTLWGNPASPAHNSVRGHCVVATFVPTENLAESLTGGSCPSGVAEKPFITLPRSCEPLSATYSGTAWQDFPPVAGDIGVPTLDSCERLGFGPTITAAPTTKAAQSPTGLDFSLDVKDEGLTNPKGLAQSDIRKAQVTLPEGFTTNPALAAGLTTCSEADLTRETPDSEPGAGCPNESRIGTVEVETPLLEEPVNGSLFVATPYENAAGNSLLALYMVVRNPNLGIVIKQPLRVEPDPVTGRLTTVAEDIPQLPFSHFRLHFREGTRSPLASPPLCGEYSADAVLTPWSGTAPITTSSMFTIISGPDAGPCPSGGTPPFHPALEAGTINNAAGQYSPFYVHMSRNDGEQEITHFSIKLPPGVIGKLAGITYCTDSAIAAAAARTGPHGGAEELANPSCPAASEVGHTLVGAGVGPSPAYAPGKMYLAGPYHGSPISLVAITAAKVGPFDLGTVVVRFAIRINPETAEVFVDAAGSDPLPHIIKGIPVHLRDIRAYVDRPNFVLNPTSCERTSTASTVLGSGTNFASEADDQPITVTSPFQAASCASLGFAPKVKLALKGGTKRNQNPALTAVVTPKAGDANIGYARVTLPHSEFLDNAHIKTVCTRVQFNAGGGNGEQCPADSVYGRAEAVTPLLDQPLSGPVFLRSSSHKLPDLVAALHGQQINIDLDGKIDSPKGGRIRTTFEAVPDAPVTKFTLAMFGGKKSLLVNSTNLCKGTHKAIAEFKGQNGKPDHFEPSLQTKCGKGAKGKKHAKKSGKTKRVLAAYLGRAGW
jgi:hypothetical protein